MEVVSSILQPYKGIIASITSIATILQIFTGVLVCFDIYKLRSTKGISAIPFVGGTVIGVLGIRYALILGDKPMFDVNVATMILNSIYTTFYFLYCKDRRNCLYKPILGGVGLIITLIIYVKLEDQDEVEFRYGLILTIFMLMLMGSPLKEIKNIIREKDASCIIFPITFVGFIVSVLWLIYGIVLLNNFIMTQSSIGSFLCLIQLVLYFKYTGKEKKRLD